MFKAKFRRSIFKATHMSQLKPSLSHESKLQSADRCYKYFVSSLYGNKIMFSK